MWVHSYSAIIHTQKKVNALIMFNDSNQVVKTLLLICVLITMHTCVPASYIVHYLSAFIGK